MTDLNAMFSKVCADNDLDEAEILNELSDDLEVDTYENFADLIEQGSVDIVDESDIVTLLEDSELL